jgi:CBS domain-containing protein
MSAHEPLDRTVADLMNPRVVSILPDASVWELAALLSREQIGAVPVVDASGRPVGVASASDLLWICEQLLDPGDRATERPRSVRELMSPDVLSVAPSTTLRELCRFFVRAGVHRAIVLDGSKLAGVVSLTDLLGYVATRGPDLRVGSAT